MPGVACHALRTPGSAQSLPQAASAAASMLITAPAVAAEGAVGAAAVVQMASSSSSKGGSSWGKDKLQPPAAAAKDWQSPGTLKVGAMRQSVGLKCCKADVCRVVFVCCVVCVVAFQLLFCCCSVLAVFAFFQHTTSYCAQCLPCALFCLATAVC
jgi:hypothetical protein